MADADTDESDRDLDRSTAMRLAISYFGFLYVQTLFFAVFGPIVPRAHHVPGIVITPGGMRPPAHVVPSAVAWTFVPMLIALGFGWGTAFLSRGRRIGAYQLGFVLAAATLAAAHDGALTFGAITRAIVGIALLIFCWNETT